LNFCYIYAGVPSDCVSLGSETRVTYPGWPFQLVCENEAAFWFIPMSVQVNNF